MILAPHDLPRAANATLADLAKTIRKPQRFFNPALLLLNPANGKEARFMPGRWLFKTEPDEYSYDDLERDKKAVWEGVSNNQALKNLREVRLGDLSHWRRQSDCGVG
jgi:hypothetical protein